MTRRWHPVLGTPDPSDAWFGPAKVAELRRAEQIDRAVARRDAFEQAIAELDNPSPEVIRDLWDQPKE